MIYRRTRPRVKRNKPRRGGWLKDREYLAWLHQQPCIVHNGSCTRWVEAHHVGHPRNDRRAVPLCALLHREGSEAIHRVGRRNFEIRFNLSLEAAITGLNEEYEVNRGRKIA